MRFTSSRQFIGRLFFFTFITSIFLSCETHNFDKDKRQIMAKDEIRSQLHKISNYDITGFREDTLTAIATSNLKKEIRYQLDFQYTDSTNILQKKTGEVFFTPDGLSILRSTISDK